tara:strand:+ start:2635 stop:4278 length:1644 start_codon:yes stop_codon:yes gene_type:complete
MAITRGQMQRQLRQSGGIMDVASGTIGGGDYAGIPMGSRTGFGFLRKLKKRVRKIIPNEIADIAVKAAPFVAPFNPIVAGAMAGIGSLDQTGNVADAFKRGALTFGGGQLARFIGGAGFQDPSLSAFTPSGFRAGFSSPLGTKTGLGKFLDQRNQQAAAKAIAEQGKANKAAFDAGISEVTGVGGEKFATADAATDFVSKVKNPVKGDTNFIGELFGNIKNKDYGAVGDQLIEGTKSIGKMIFFDDKGNVDKAAVLAAASMAASYKEAKELADDAGVDITEEEYDEAKKADKKEEYAGYLQNFFGGKKDGGRIGFARGTDLNESDEIEEFKKLISGEIIENEDPDMKDMDDLMAGGGISFSRAEKSFLFRRLGGSGGRDRSYTMPQLYKILSNPNDPSNIGDATILKQIAVVGLGGKKDGGRIELGTGSRPSQLFKLLEEAEAAGDMDKVKEIKSDLFKEFGLKLAMGGEVPVRKNKAGIEELDYRESGGFVPVGVKERADDVPAMLSKNEFVMTADAVRGIGDGDVEKGAQKLYNVMKQAEKVGKA